MGLKVSLVSLRGCFWGLLFASEGYVPVAVAPTVRGASASAWQPPGRQEARLPFPASPPVLAWSSVEGRCPPLGLRGCKRGLSAGLVRDIPSGTSGRIPPLDLRCSVPSRQQLLVSEAPVESWGGRRAVGWDRLFGVGTS